MLFMWRQLRPLSSVTQMPPSLPDRQMIGVRGVDPDGVHVAVNARESGLNEIMAAVFGHIDVDAAEPDFQIVVRIDADLAEVGRARIGIAHARPARAFIFGAIDAAEGPMLDQRVNDVACSCDKCSSAQRPMSPVAGKPFVILVQCAPLSVER